LSYRIQAPCGDATVADRFNTDPVDLTEGKGTDDETREDET
jgi:hypothetical protein